MLKLDDEKKQREIITFEINLKCYQAVESILLNWSEMDMLEYREKLNKDKDAQEEYKLEMGKPIP